eukprot:394272_1
MGVNKGQIGGIIGSLGLLMLVMAFFINNLSGQDTNQRSTKCTWNKIEICAPDCKEDTFQEGCETDKDVCYTRDAGIVYLIFLLLAVLCSLIAVLSVFVRAINNKLKQYIRFLFLICAICCIIAITTWIGVGSNSKICFDPNWINDTAQYKYNCIYNRVYNFMEAT